MSGPRFFEGPARLEPGPNTIFKIRPNTARFIKDRQAQVRSELSFPKSAQTISARAGT